MKQIAILSPHNERVQRKNRRQLGMMGNFHLLGLALVLKFLAPKNVCFIQFCERFKLCEQITLNLLLDSFKIHCLSFDATVKSVRVHPWP